MKNKTTLTVEPGKQEIITIREFDAPRELLFKHSPIRRSWRNG
ncbi:MAG: hypothetical protein WDO14_17550 [Bacteroidota bacterium]